MVQLFGRLTGNAIASTTKSGKSVINFTIALNDDYKDTAGKKIKRITYIRCAYWVNKTTVADYLVKGKQVEVFGRLFPSVFTNQQGEAIANINATVEKLKFHGGAGGGSNNATAKQTTAAPAAVDSVDDLPF